MYIIALISDTFLAKNSPNVTAGLMCPPASAWAYPHILQGGRAHLLKNILLVLNSR
ncbi:hypothetical protein Hanom_Chr07g00657271 [Helianthus anomalus]